MKLMLFFTLWSLLLCGCQLSGEVENQAYVLVLGMDRQGDGSIALTARVPKIGSKGSADKGADSAGDDPYLTFTVAGANWSLALEALQQATPRRMNLSHIELLIISESLAGEATFPALAWEIAQTPHLYTTASFVICEGSARDFVKAGETVIGTRMSSELRAMLKHYASQGYIPEATFAEAVFAANSCYSDPVAIRAYVEGEDDTSERILNTPMKQRYSGAALLRHGVFIRALSLEQTRLLGLIRGQTRVFPFEWDNDSYELTPVASAHRRIIWEDDVPRLSLEVVLSTDDPVPPGLADELKHQLEAMIRECQRDGCDPFGFGEIAAGHFLTVPEWMSSGWRNRYAKAEIEVSVVIQSNNR